MASGMNAKSGVRISVLSYIVLSVNRQLLGQAVRQRVVTVALMFRLTIMADLRSFALANTRTYFLPRNKEWLSHLPRSVIARLVVTRLSLASLHDGTVLTIAG